MTVKPPLIALFGAPAFIEGDESRPLQMSEKTLALLALLTCSADRPLSRSRLASTLWPDVDEARARTNLRRHFYKLAKALPELAARAMVLTKNNAQWNRSAKVRVDVIEFTGAIESGDLERASQAYRGALCIGCYEDAVLELRERLQSRYVDLLRERARAARQERDHARTLLALEHLAAQDPLNESWVRELAHARLEAGDRPGARRELAALVTRLRSELGVEPDEQTSKMLAGCLERGEVNGRGNLPVETDSFVGRERTMTELAGRIAASAWVSIAGPAGVGKTRVAVHAARVHAAQFPDGAWFVDLAAARTWSEALRRIAATFALSVESDDPEQTLREYLREKRLLLVLDNLEQLDERAGPGIDALLEQSAAKVLTTSRRRLNGVSEDVYVLGSLTLPPAPLPPSQSLGYAAVRLFAERAGAVAPAFALSHENVAHVTGIVSQLDGLPLAIELVAARANLLTIEGIAKRLSDLDEFRHKGREGRHQTISAALAWSYDLLSPVEQLLLRRLAVFDGSFDLAALEAICGDGERLPPARVFAVLSELVEASLVVTRRSERSESQRYDLLETVRRFVRALPGNGAQTLREEHARYFGSLVRRLSEFAEGAREAEYYGPIDDEYANVRAALDFALENDVASAAAIIGALYRYWVMRGRLREGCRAASVCAAGAADAGLAQEVQARFYQAYGILLRELGENAEAERCLDRALASYRSIGEERRESDVLFAQAKIAYNVGDEPRALELYRRCIELMERLGDEHGRASAIANVGAIAHRMNDLAEAERMYRIALAEYRRLGYLRGLAFIYRQLSLVRQNAGDLDGAVDFARHSIAISVEIGELDREADAQVIFAAALTESGRAGEALPALARAIEILERSENAQFLMYAVDALGRAARSAGSHTDAIRFWGFSLAMRRRKKLASWQEDADQLAAEIEQVRAAVPEAQFNAAWAAGETMTPAEILSATRRLAAAASREDDSRTIRSL